jgi:hypothetical protein
MRVNAVRDDLDRKIDRGPLLAVHQHIEAINAFLHDRHTAESDEQVVAERFDFDPFAPCRRVLAAIRR